MYRTWGEHNYDEDVTQLAHALQCATLARQDGAGDTLIAAALLHDIGHLFEIERNNGPDHRIDLRHEDTGSSFLSGSFPPSVTVPIALHVEAKRYLATTEPGYLDSLSRGSTRSLVVQGGPFSAEECARFIEQEGGTDAVRLRRWDDRGKIVDLDVAPLEQWLPLLERVATASP